MCVFGLHFTLKFILENAYVYLANEAHLCSAVKRAATEAEWLELQCKHATNVQSTDEKVFLRMYNM